MLPTSAERRPKASISFESDTALRSVRAPVTDTSSKFVAIIRVEDVFATREIEEI